MTEKEKVSKRKDFDWHVKTSPEEEFANTFTHAIAVVLSIPMLHQLIQKGKSYQDEYAYYGYLIFGVCTLVLYSASTLYHGWPKTKVKIFLRYFDHCSVYIMIAGSFSVFDLVTLSHDPVGIKSFKMVWGIAITGIIAKLFFFSQTFKYTSFFYLAMGWFLAYPMSKMYHCLSSIAIKYVFYGGIAYSVGVLFFLWESLKYHHAIFHCFLLLGTYFHYVCALYYLPVHKK